MTPEPINLNLKLQACDELIGSKFAVWHGETLYVSPAMHALITNADDADELQFVMSHIQIFKPYKPYTYTVSP